MKYHWFGLGDINACFALTLDNMVNLTVFASILTGGFGFPPEIVFLKMIPGTALGVLLGDGVYSYLAVRLAQRTGRQEVTAMPLGLDTPSTLGMALTVLGPAYIGIKGDLLQAGMDVGLARQEAGMRAWAIGMASMMIMGAVKVLFSFSGEWIRQRVPRAGLLGSVGGVGLMLLAFFPLLEIFRAPVVGLVCLGLVVYTLLARIPLPYNLPGAAVAVGVGTLLYYILGNFHLLGDAPFMVPQFSPSLAVPLPTLAGLRALPEALPYLPIALPFGLLTVIGGINVTESARAAGDDYVTRDILLTEALATLVAGFFGGVAQSTPFIGHPAYKHMQARAGYTLITGLVVGLGGMLGIISFMAAALPLAAVTPILIFVGFEITVQAFQACPQRHAPAVAFAFLPILGNLLLIRQEATFGALDAAISRSAAQLGAHLPMVRQLVQEVAHSAEANVVMGLGHGFILTGMLWGSFCALVIERKLGRAAFFVALCGVLTLFGAIHSWSPTGDLYWPWHPPSPMVLHWAAGYFALALMLLVLAPTRGAQAPAQ